MIERAAVLAMAGLAMLAATASAAPPAPSLTLQAIADDPVAPKAVPKAYDLTIVVFSDYQCPYCRKIHPVLEQFRAEDGRVRIVYKDWPVFGEASVLAARAAIASQWQGRYDAFNDALMETQGRLGAPEVRAAADRAGVDWSRLERDLKSHKTDVDALLARSHDQAIAMGLQGTPGLLIGRYLIPGAIDIVQLRAVAAEARAKSK